MSGLCFHASSDRELTTSQGSHARDSVPVSNLAPSCPLGLTRTRVPLPQDCRSESGPMCHPAHLTPPGTPIRTVPHTLPFAWPLRLQGTLTGREGHCCRGAGPVTLTLTLCRCL